jgi:four helix bundle protein
MSEQPKTLPYVSNFRDLSVYQKSRMLSQTVFELSKAFPREEMYSLTDQVRRSSRSIGAPIAEAWAKRRYEKHFVSKLTDADGEQMETQHWLETASDSGYLSSDRAAKLVNDCEEIGRMLGSMIEKADKFCGSPSTRVHEDVAEYFSKSDR